MALRLWRSIVQILWPLRHTEEMEGWGSVFWQATVLLGLGSVAAAVLSGSPFAIAVYALLILLALTFSAVFRLQGRVEVVYTRQELLDARNALGRIIADAGDLFIGGKPGKPFGDQALEIYTRTLELIWDDSSVFDDSHEGRFYAVSVEAEMRVKDVSSKESTRHTLRAQIRCLNEFITEINAELNTMPRFR